MRELIKTQEYQEFVASVSQKVRNKIDYVTNIIIQSPIVNSKFVKKLENTEFYEMRISVDNEYRVILFSIDHPNFVQATKILLLNGFLKKNTKDYPQQIAIAKKIIEKLSAPSAEKTKHTNDEYKD